MLNMTDYAKKEEKILTKISERIDALDNNLSKLAESSNKVEHFFEQEKALYDIKSIIRSENKLDEDETNDEENALKEDTNTIKNISQKIDDLETRLKSLDDNDSKVKSYIEQKKAIDDIKNIINDVLK